jgi:hypothetical protein
MEIISLFFEMWLTVGLHHKSISYIVIEFSRLMVKLRRKLQIQDTLCKEQAQQIMHLP